MRSPQLWNSPVSESWQREWQKLLPRPEVADTAPPEVMKPEHASTTGITSAVEQEDVVGECCVLPPRPSALSPRPLHRRQRVGRRLEDREPPRVRVRWTRWTAQTVLSEHLLRPCERIGWMLVLRQLG